MKTSAKLIMLLLMLGGGINASSQGFLKKLDNLKNKTNYLDNKVREVWIPFPNENYNIKSITCSYGSTPAYQLQYNYNQNGLLSSIDLYSISPRSGRTNFNKTISTFIYNYKEDVVIQKSFINKRGSEEIYSYKAYKMVKGKVVGTAYAEEPFTFPIKFRDNYTYNEAGKLASTNSFTYTYNDKNLLTRVNSDYNGVISTTTYEYDPKNPFLVSCKVEEKKSNEDTTKIMAKSYRIISKGRFTEAVVSYVDNSKEFLVVERDPLERIISVTDNRQDRLLKATIEYDERVSNEKLFAFKTDPIDFYQQGNIASLYNIPFYMFYFDED